MYVFLCAIKHLPIYLSTVTYSMDQPKDRIIEKLTLAWINLDYIRTFQSVPRPRYAVVFENLGKKEIKKKQ